MKTKNEECEQCQEKIKLLATALYKSYDLILDMSMNGGIKVGVSKEDWFEKARQVRIEIEHTVIEFKDLFVKIAKEDFDKRQNDNG